MQNPELELQYKSCYARILDAKRRFLEAATRYYDLSQSSSSGSTSDGPKVGTSIALLGRLFHASQGAPDHPTLPVHPCRSNIALLAPISRAQPGARISQAVGDQGCQNPVSARREAGHAARRSGRQTWIRR